MLSVTLAVIVNDDINIIFWLIDKQKGRYMYFDLVSCVH